MSWRGFLFDNLLVRALPDINIKGWGIVRVGWSWRPDWDHTLWQPWYGKWWVWLGPYVIGDLEGWGK